MKIFFRFSVYLLLVLFSLFSDNDAFPQGSAKTNKQIQQLVQKKGSRIPLQSKIDSRLLQAVREKRGKKIMKGAKPEPANVNVDDNGNLMVDIKAEVSDALLNKITSLGGKIIYPSKQYHTIRAQINLSMVETIAGYAAVQFIQPAVRAMNNGSINSKL